MAIDYLQTGLKCCTECKYYRCGDTFFPFCDKPKLKGKSADICIIDEPSEIPMFKESAEAYKEWTGEDMGKSDKREYENAIAIIEELYDAHSEGSGVPADIITMTRDEIIKALEEAVRNDKR